MKKIFKYELPTTGGTTKRIDAKVIEWLDIKVQDGIPRIWAIVEEDAYEMDSYEIAAWGTGWEVPEEFSNYAYMGTAFDDWDFVWHYFMRQLRPSATNKTIDQIKVEDGLVSKILRDNLYIDEQSRTVPYVTLR
jgi:hypothetical protein